VIDWQERLQDAFAENREAQAAVIGELNDKLRFTKARLDAELRRRKSAQKSIDDLRNDFQREIDDLNKALEQAEDNIEHVSYLRDGDLEYIDQLEGQLDNALSNLDQERNQRTESEQRCKATEELCLQRVDDDQRRIKELETQRDRDQHIIEELRQLYAQECSERLAADKKKDEELARLRESEAALKSTLEEERVKLVDREEELKHSSSQLAELASKVRIRSFLYSILILFLYRCLYLVRNSRTLRKLTRISRLSSLTLLRRTLISKNKSPRLNL